MFEAPRRLDYQFGRNCAHAGLAFKRQDGELAGHAGFHSASSVAFRQPRLFLKALQRCLSCGPPDDWERRGRLESVVGFWGEREVGGAWDGADDGANGGNGDEGFVDCGECVSEED